MKKFKKMLVALCLCVCVALSAGLVGCADSKTLAEIDDLKAKIEQKDGQIGDLTTSNSQKDAALAEKDATIAGKNNDINNKDTIIAEKDKQIEGLEKDKSDLNAKNDELTKSNGTLSDANKTLTDTNKNLTDSNNQKDQTIANNNTEIADKDQKIQDMTLSDIQKMNIMMGGFAYADSLTYIFDGGAPNALLTKTDADSTFTGTSGKFIPYAYYAKPHELFQQMLLWAYNNNIDGTKLVDTCIEMNQSQYDESSGVTMQYFSRIIVYYTNEKYTFMQHSFTNADNEKTDEQSIKIELGMTNGFISSLTIESKTQIKNAKTGKVNVVYNKSVTNYGYALVDMGEGHGTQPELATFTFQVAEYVTDTFNGTVDNTVDFMVASVAGIIDGYPAYAIVKRASMIYGYELIANSEFSSLVYGTFDPEAATAEAYKSKAAAQLEIGRISREKVADLSNLEVGQTVNYLDA